MQQLNRHLICLALLAPIFLPAQQLAHYDILQFNIAKSTEGNWQLSVPRFLTAFNARGYNNQPKFFSDNELWITAQTPDDTTQTDIFALDLLSKTFTRVTATTATAEYSPTPMPGGKRFSCVRVEEDGNQRLWSFPMDRSDNGQPVFPRLFNVGYHCWVNDTLAAVFIVGENGAPHLLQSIGTRGQMPRRLASNIGRCLLKTADGKLAFIQKPTEQTWFLKTWNPADNTQDIVVKTPTGSEDFAILNDGTFLISEGARLFSYKFGKDSDWREVANLSKYGVKKITRLGVSKDGKLAVVVE